MLTHTRSSDRIGIGLEFPTMADLAVVVIAKGCMPFQAAGRNKQPPVATKNLLEDTDGLR